MTAGGDGIVYYGNYKEADGVNSGGSAVKQDAAVNDKNGILRMEISGLAKEATKANEPAKPNNGDASKNLSDALSAAKDAAKEGDIKAEAEKVPEQKSEQPAVPAEPVAPAEPATAYDTDSNLLDGNGSVAFKTANFESSGSGSAA